MSATPGPYRPPRSNTARNIILGIVGGTLTVVVIVVVALLAGGGDSGLTADQADNAGQDTNERGNVPVEIGEPVSLDSGATMTVTKIEVDPDCADAPADPADHVIAVTVSAETSTSMVHFYWTPEPSGAAWAVIDDTGTTVTDQAMRASGSCKEIPMLGPGQSGEGVVLLSAPAEAGTLIFHEKFIAGFTNYEWQF